MENFNIAETWLFTGRLLFENIVCAFVKDENTQRVKI